MKRHPNKKNIKIEENSGDEEDFSYHIETTQNAPVATARPSETQSYLQQLESKIREQARRGSELEKYKYLCEKRIKQINPSEQLPLTEDILNTPATSDTVVIEEQRNYIDLLKKTIESDLLKNGLLNRYITTEGVIDGSKVKIEAEDYRKKLVLAQSMINSLKSDVEDLTKENNYFKSGTTNSCVNSNNDQGANNMKNSNNGMVNETITLLSSEKTQLVNEKHSLESQISQGRDQNNVISEENKTLKNSLKMLNKSSSEQMGSINQRLNDYKVSYEKISKDFEQGLTEKNSIQKANAELINENNKYQDQIYSLEVEIDKRTSNANYERGNGINDDYRQMYNELGTENTKLKTIINKKNNSVKYSDLTNNNELSLSDCNTRIQGDINQLQIENEKIKIDNANLTNDKLNGERENEVQRGKGKTLNIEKVKLNGENEKYLKKGKQLEEAYDQEKEENKNIKHSYQIEINKEKIKTDEYNKSTNTISTEYDELGRKYNYLNDKQTSTEKEGNDLKASITTVKKERDNFELIVKRIENENNMINNKCIKLETEYSMMKKNEQKLKKIIEEAENKVEETLCYNEKITVQIKEMENEIGDKEQTINELHGYKESFENEIAEKLKVFDDYVVETKTYISDLLKLLFTIANEFNKLSNEDLNSLLSKTFSQGLTKVISQINSINNISNYNITLNDKLFFETISQFFTLMSSELENIYNKVLDSNNCIKESNSRLMTLEDEIKTKKQNEEKITKISLKEKETKANILQKERDNIFKDYSIIKGKTHSGEKDNYKYKMENIDLKNQNKELYEKHSSSEAKCVMVVKSRKYLLSLIQKFLKCFPFKDMTRVMLEMLNMNESISKGELDKYIIDDKIQLIVNENKTLSEDETYPDSDLANKIKTEHENGIKGSADYDTKISSKKEKMKLLNEEYEKYEGHYKVNSQKDKENYNKALTEINNGKNVIYQGNLNNRQGSGKNKYIIETTLKDGEENKYEINMGDSRLIESSDRERLSVGKNLKQDGDPMNKSGANDNIDNNIMLTIYDEIA